MDNRTKEKGFETASTHFLVFLVFALVGLLLYGHTLQAPLYLDDIINIRDNLRAINSLSFHELLNSAFGSFLPRRPLTNLSFCLNYYFHGHKLPGYHLVNIVIHVMNGMLLYLFLFKTITLPGQRNPRQHAVSIATLASLLWFVNPMQIQSVTYIVQRMTSMATLFFLCSFLSYLYARLAQKALNRLALFGLSVLCWILSMASKEIALTLPGLIFVYEWFFFQDLNRVWLKKSAIYLVTGLTGLVAATCLVYKEPLLGFLTTIYQPRGYTAFERILTEGRVIFIYMSLLVYPHPSRLTLNHDIPISHSLIDPLTTLLSFVGLFALAVLTVLAAKRYRLFAFCIIWFLANLSIEAMAASIEPMFEHRVYLPSMLFFLAIVWTGFRSFSRPKIVIAAMTALVIVFSFWTYARNALWNDPVAFWENAVRKSPKHYRSHFNLGTSYLHAGSYERAITAFEKSLTLTPPYPTEIYTNIGALYLETGQHDLARQNLNRAASLNPNNYMAHDLLASLDQKEGNYTEALKHYGAAIRINPNFAPSYHNLGILYTEMEELDNAVGAFQQAIVLRPKSAEAYSSLGLARARQGRYDLAIPTLRKAIRLDAKNQEALFNLATAYNMIGQYEMAAQTYKTLLNINQKDVEAMHNLGMIYLKHFKNMQQARFYFKKALVTDSNYDHAAAARDILSQMTVKAPANKTKVQINGSTSRAGNRPVKP